MRKWQWLLILLVFVGMRIPKWWSYDPDTEDLFRLGRTFDRYGFLERRGVLISEVHGKVSDPSDYDYPDHSPIPYWIGWALMRLLGDRSVWFIGLALGWLNLVLAWRVAHRARFSASQMTCFLLLWSASPTLARFELELLVVYLAAQLLGFWVILRQSDAALPENKLSLMVYLLAVVVALTGDWVGGFTVSGWLLYLWWERRNPRLRGWWVWTLIALVVAVGAYATYVVRVSPPGVSGYVLRQAGMASGGAVPRSRLLLALVLKFFLLTGPLTALVGVLALIGFALGRLGSPAQSSFMRLAAIQVAPWFVFHGIFSHLCAVEQWTYGFFVLPLAGLACIPLGNACENRSYSSVRRRAVIVALAGTVAFQFAFVWLRWRLEGDTSAALTVASFLRQQTQLEDLILSRVSYTSTPLALDEGVLEDKANRLIYFPDPRDYDRWWTTPTGPQAKRYVLVQDNSPDPLPAAVAALPMEPVAAVTVRVAERKINLAARLQLLYWRLRGLRPQLPQVGQPATNVTIRLFRVKTSETSAFPPPRSGGSSK